MTRILGRPQGYAAGVPLKLVIREDVPYRSAELGVSPGVYEATWSAPSNRWEAGGAELNVIMPRWDREDAIPLGQVNVFISRTDTGAVVGKYIYSPAEWVETGAGVFDLGKGAYTRAWVRTRQIDDLTEAAEGSALRAEAAAQSVTDATLDLSQEREKVAQALVDTAQSAAEALAMTGIDPAYISETTADPPAAPNGTRGARRTEDGGIVRLEVVDNLWTIRGEAIPGQRQIEPLNHATLAAALTSTTTAPRHLIGGRRGGTFDLLPVGDPTPADGGMVIARQDGRKLRRQAAPDGLHDPAWWGVPVDGTTDPASLAAWVGYMAAHGGKYALLPGDRITGNVYVDTPQRYLSIVGPGATIDGPDTSKPVLHIDDRARKGGGVSGLRLTMSSVGTLAPLGGTPQLEPRRTLGGHGLYVRYGKNWQVTGNTVFGVASIGICMFNVKGYTVSGNNVEITMADGIHNTRGCKRFTITGNNVYNTGDDGIASVSDKHWHKQSPNGPDDDSEAPICENGTVVGNTVVNTGARGISVVGGKNITVGANVIDTTYLANILITQAVAAPDLPLAADTHPVLGCTISGGILRGANQHQGGHPSEVHGAIQVDAGTFDVVIGGALDIAGSRGPGLAIYSPHTEIGAEVVLHDNASGLLARAPLIEFRGTIRHNAGTGVDVAGFEIDLDGARIYSNGGAGVVAQSGAVVTATGCRIRDNGTAPGAPDGQVVLGDNGQITMLGCTVRGQRLYGVVANSGCTATLISCDVRGGGTVAGAVAGAGGTLISRGSLGQADAT